jgi:hypothetical protein
MSKKTRAYFCNVVGENVKIHLENKVNFSQKYKKDLFVKCDQEDCQFVDENKSPCPLEKTMFSTPPSI